MTARLTVKQIMVLWLAVNSLTVVVSIVAAGTGNTVMSATSAAIFTLSSVMSGWLSNARLTTANDITQKILAAEHNAAMLAGVFCWGGITILGGYYLTGLFWHHAWQYGGATISFAAGLLAYILFLRNPASSLRSQSKLKAAAVLAAVQACATAAGLAFLLWSGKLATTKQDWFANHVFLAGGIAVVVLSVLSTRAQFHMHPETNKLSAS